MLAAPLLTQALRFYVDLRAPVSKPLLVMLADACADAAEAKTLRDLAVPSAKQVSSPRNCFGWLLMASDCDLAVPSAKQAFHDYILRDGRGLAELLAHFPSCAPSWALLLELAPKLTPRYYTISSSPAKDASTVHLSVKVLNEPMRGAEGRTKEGVCSTQASRLLEDCSRLLETASNCSAP